MDVQQPSCELLQKFVHTMALTCNKKWWLGSNEASMMIGHQCGVSALLKQVAPWIIAKYCVTHRLALATAQAAKEILYKKEVQGSSRSAK